MKKGNAYREEKNKMNPTLVKILLPIIAVTGVGCIVYGVNTYYNAKEAELQQVATQIEISIQDNTEKKTPTEVAVENAMKQQAQSQKQEKPKQETVKPVEETVKKSKEFVIKEVEIQTMYATSTVNIRKGPNEVDFEKIGQLMENDAVQVIGLVNKYGEETCLWYQIQDGSFVNGAYLSLEKLEVYAEEPDYSAHESLDERIQNNPELQKIAEDIAREIYKSNGGGQVHQVSQEVLDALGATPDQGPQRPGVHFGQGDLPDSLKGGRLE